MNSAAQGKKVFVTGGTGFIGLRVLQELAKRKYRIAVLTKERSSKLQEIQYSGEIILGDMGKSGAWQKKVKTWNPEYAIHLAWEGIPDYGAVMSVKNVLGSIRVFQTLMETRCKRICATGSCWEYTQKNAFTAAKQAAKELGEHLAKEAGKEFFWGRIFYAYGAGQREGALIPHIISCVLKGEHPEIKSPSAENDFIYVEDVAKGLCDILEKAKGGEGAFDLGTGKYTSVGKVVEMVYAAYNKKKRGEGTPKFQKASPVYGPKADTRHMKNLGWAPRVMMQEGIQRMVTYASNKK